MIFLSDTEVLLCYSFMASGTDNEQTHLINMDATKDRLTKCSLRRKPQWTWAWYSSSEGANIKTGINQNHAPFPQVHNLSFSTRGRQHQSQLKVVIVPFVSGSPLTFGQACCCSCLIQILLRWAASVSQNLSSPVHKEKQSSRLLSELLP